MSSYWNQSVVDQIAMQHELSQEQAEQVFRALLQFLELAASSDEVVAPSSPIDAAWHTFILRTRDYAAYCEEQLGQYVHHEPVSPGEVDPTRYVRTLALARSKFGDLDEFAWLEPGVQKCGTPCESGPHAPCRQPPRCIGK